VAGWLGLCALVIGLLAGEVWLRARWRAGESGALRYARQNAFLQNQGLGVSTGLWLVPQESYKPGASVVFESEGVLHEVRINSRGFRTAEFGVPKPEGTFRILCIGASTTFQGLTNETTYPALLGARLRTAFPGRHLEVLDLGISGTRSDYWNVRMDNLLALEPDLVVQYNGINDIIQEHTETWAAAHPLGARWRAASHLWNRWVPLATSRYEPLLARTRGRFLELDRGLAQRGVDHLVGTIAAPDPSALTGGLRQYMDRVTREWSGGRLGDFGQYRALVDLHNSALLAWCAEHGVPCARPDLAVRRPEQYLDICHMHPTGIEALAAAFLEVVEARLRARWRIDSSRPAD
jgi:lysophospholipase L1-like esterase